MPTEWTALIATIVPIILAGGGFMGWIIKDRISAANNERDYARSREDKAIIERDSYRVTSETAVLALEQIANERRSKAGQAALPTIIAAVPSHHSPVSQEQQDVADLSDIQARLGLVRADLGIVTDRPAETLEYDEGVTPRSGMGGVAEPASTADNVNPDQHGGSLGAGGVTVTPGEAAQAVADSAAEKAAEFTNAEPEPPV